MVCQWIMKYSFTCTRQWPEIEQVSKGDSVPASVRLRAIVSDSESPPRVGWPLHRERATWGHTCPGALKGKRFVVLRVYSLHTHTTTRAPPHAHKPRATGAHPRVAKQAQPASKHPHQNLVGSDLSKFKKIWAFLKMSSPGLQEPSLERAGSGLKFWQWNSALI